MVMNIVLVTNPNIGLYARIALVASLTYMIVVWLIAIINRGFLREYRLYTQILYFVSFHIPLILATYFS